MLETLKNINKDKKKEKLIYILILLIVLFVAISLIFDSDENNYNNNNVSSNLSNNVNSNNNISNNESYFTSLENKLVNILNKIDGVSNVSVMMTFSNESTLNPIYNIKEEEKDGNVTTEREVVYNEEDKGKVLAVETIEMPKIEAVIVVGNGLNDINMKTKVIEAVASVTNIGIHKVKVFEKGE